MAATSSDDEQLSPTNTPDSPLAHKRPRPFVVKNIAVIDLQNTHSAGYMERKGLSGNWTRYWFQIQGGLLYCYLTPEDQQTVDVIKLPEHSVTPMLEKFKDKKFVLHLTHEEYTSVQFSLNTRDEMDKWLEHMKTAISQQCQQTSEVNNNNGHASVEELQDKYNELRMNVKQKLLDEVLRQKYELEKKQVVRRRKNNMFHDPDSPESAMSEEQRLTDMTRLTQRRFSTQIKMDTIQKQLHHSNHPKKSYFPFGPKNNKKLDGESDNREHLENQLHELMSRLDLIDQDLRVCRQEPSAQETFPSTTHTDLPHRSFSHNGEGRVLDKDPFDIHRDLKDMNRSLSWKSSVQSFAKLKLSKKKRATKVSRGSSLESNSHGDTTDSETDDDVVLDKRTDMLIDLTKSQPGVPKRDFHLDLNIARSHESSSISSDSFKNSNSSLDSPRRQIAPSVMAEIDGFEEFARQMMEKSSEVASNV